MRSFDEMGTLGSPSPPSSPSRRPKRWARKCERYCCQTITYFPLVFVYGLTSWAVWVEAGMGFMPNRQCWIGPWSSALGVALYLMLNSSYTIAVFTNPGSPSTHQTAAYSHLPTAEVSDDRFMSLTVKSTGETRFCKKCQSPKPDRAHHCSSCGRCVLKMDHHFPWLATCVGLRNYKAFLLFLIYTSLFCWVCFFVSGSWVWTEIFDDSSYNSSLMPVNYVLLAVISGIIGLVLTGFTAWHIYLTVKGQTTIESLEKTRYLSPLRQRMQNQFNERHYVDGRTSIGDQIRDIHANALPGVTRPEEGVERSSPATNSLRRNWAEMERQRERDRYLDYLDEQDSEKLPNAFDLGWRRNLGHVFGPKRMLWFVPVCNTTGDGWTWEASQKWIEVSDRVAREREAEELRQRQRERDAGWNPNMESPERFFPARTVIDDRYDAQRYVPKTETRFGMPAGATNLRNLDRRREIGAIFGDDSDDDDTSDDDDEIVPETRPLRKPQKQNTENWNDIPQEFLPAPGTKPAERRSPSRKRDGVDW